MSQVVDKARERSLWNNFRLTPEMWDLIDAYQHHVCFFCGKRQPSGKRLATDHAHSGFKAGLIRGLLCSQCNRVLGKLERGFVNKYYLPLTLEYLLKRVLLYITDPPAVAALGREVKGFPGRTGTKRHRKAIKKGTF